jgi:small subunit ribosomal protein S4
MNVPPGMHGSRGRRKISEYGRQLREKQKAKRAYGLLENQFRRYVATALREKGRTGEVLLQLLERRLDSIVYRLGLVPSRFMARQLVSHGHILVDGKKVTIPSYCLKIGEVVSLDGKAAAIPAVQKLAAAAEIKLPPFLERQGLAGRLTKIPGRSEIPAEVDEQAIIEFYSR